MKTFLTLIGLVLVVGVIFYVFGNTADAPTEDESASSTTADAVNLATLEEARPGTYSVSASSSEVRWSAKKPLIESYVDRGIIPVESGEITVTADNLSTGSITFDVANIEATKTANARLGVERLTDHLRSEDFLAVEEFPTTKFTLTAAEAIASTTDETDYELTGNLTLKGETNEISFPANVGMSELGALVVEENTEIDRSRWNIRYGSESFFDDLGDNLIANEVEIEIDLVARLEN